LENKLDNESGLITSDSDFEVAAQAAGYAHDNFNGNNTTKDINIH
jgi:hypothetical protein